MRLLTDFLSQPRLAFGISDNVILYLPLSRDWASCMPQELGRIPARQKHWCITHSVLWVAANGHRWLWPTDTGQALV